MEWSQNIVAGRKNQPFRQPLFTPRGPKTTQPERDSKSPGNSVSIAPSMSSGRMLDTVENVAAYYGPAVFVFFAACFGRVL